MIDEQRFRARLAALDAAAGVLSAGGVPSMAEMDRMAGVAERFEAWLLRPVPGEQDGMPSSLQPARQSCGAFLQPDWYTGDRWNVCSGEHVTADDAGATPLTVGWHWTGPPLRGGIFATHHMVTLRDVPTGRCACGAPWPCPGGEVDSKT